MDLQRLENAVYEAILGYCEGLEHGGKYGGNGHHLAQHLTGLVVDSERVKKLAAAENRALRRAAQDALELLDRQREEYNAHPPVAPLGIGGPAEEGPIAKALRAALSSTPAAAEPAPRPAPFFILPDAEDGDAAETLHIGGIDRGVLVVSAAEVVGLRPALAALIEATNALLPVLAQKVDTGPCMHDRLEGVTWERLLGGLSAALAGARAALGAKEGDSNG